MTRSTLICVLAGFLFAAPVAASDTSAAKLCGFSPVEWSAKVGLSAKQRRGEPMPFTVPNLVLAISLLELSERMNDPALRAYAEEVATRWMSADGAIAVFPPSGFPVIETIPAGRILVRMHERTGDERYRKAADAILAMAGTNP